MYLQSTVYTINAYIYSDVKLKIVELQVVDGRNGLAFLHRVNISMGKGLVKGE